MPGSLALSYCTDEAARKRASLICFIRSMATEGAARSTARIQATVTPMRLWPLPCPWVNPRPWASPGTSTSAAAGVMAGGVALVLRHRKCQSRLDSADAGLVTAPGPLAWTFRLICWSFVWFCVSSSARRRALESKFYVIQRILARVDAR